MKRTTTESSEGSSAIWWIRQDLRTDDNGALAAAIEHANCHGGRVIACIALSPTEYEGWAPIKVDLMLRSLRALVPKLTALGIDVFIMQETGDLVELAKSRQVGVICYTRVWEPAARVREEKLREELLSAQIAWLESTAGECIVREGAILQRDGERPYAVFTPFRKALYEYVGRQPVQLTSLPPLSVEEGGKGRLTGVIPEAIAGFELNLDKCLTAYPNRQALEQAWPAGEEAAQTRLQAFLAAHGQDYQETRDRYGDEPSLFREQAAWGTSRLSPYLALGIISARRCWHEALLKNGGRPENGAHPGLTSWLSELVWRDFYRHLPHHHPRLLCHGNEGIPFSLL